MVEFAIFLYGPADETVEEPAAGRPPAQDANGAKHQRHSDDLAKSGAMVLAYELGPASTARSIRADYVATDGPFIETKEVVVGFYVIEAPDFEAAVEIARQNPILSDGGGLEVRRVVRARAPDHPGNP
jgi:hypothetical protein